MLVVILVVSVNLAVAVVQVCTKVHSLAAPPAKPGIHRRCFAKNVSDCRSVVFPYRFSNFALASVYIADASQKLLKMIC